jgi:CHASE2 domain-containing sensor protein
VDTVAAGLPVREPGRAPILLITVWLTGLAALGVLCMRRPAFVVVLSAAVAALYLKISFPLFWREGQVLPVSSPLLLALFGLSLALAVRRTLPPRPQITP